MKIIPLLTCFFVAINLSAQIHPAAEHSDTTTYYFDYQLLPNTHYVFTSLRDALIENRTEGKIPEEEFTQMPGLRKSLNGSHRLKQGEIQTLITENQIGKKINFTSTVDSTISDMNHPFLKDIPGLDIEDIAASIRTRKAFGHTVDHKKLKTDTITGRELKYLGSKYFGYNVWTSQKQLPEGTMMVGDTFSVLPPVRKRKHKKATMLTPEQIEKMDSTKLKRHKQMLRLREGLNKSTSESYAYYILKSVKDDVAYFTIETYSKSTMPDLMESESSGTGELEYNFKYKCFTKYILNNTSSIKTTEETLTSNNNTVSTITRTIEIKE